MYVAELSFELGLINQELLDRHRSVLKNLNLPVTYKDGSWLELLDSMRLDKKSRGKNLRFVTITEIGKTQRLESPQESALLKAYEKVSK
jgi:3-dehydroquinate synthase